jgi:hypothetical protein
VLILRSPGTMTLRAAMAGSGPLVAGFTLSEAAPLPRQPLMHKDDMEEGRGRNPFPLPTGTS